jgi:hypothetical protein
MMKKLSVGVSNIKESAAKILDVYGIAAEVYGEGVEKLFETCFFIE